jgi:F-type H+-transporting ATPase subunit b
MFHLLADPEVWVSFGFIIFVVLLFKRAKSMIAGSLDRRAEAIRFQIEEAAGLRRESEAALAEATRRQQAAQAEVEQILADAQSAADRLLKDGEGSVAAMLERRRASALEKIAQAEATAIADVRRRAAQLAIAATRKLLIEQAQGQLGQTLIDSAIADLPARLA